MSQILRIETTILPGRRIEITSPDLPESGPVEVVVVVPAPTTSSGVEQDHRAESVLEFLDRLPVRHHSAEWWAEREAELAKDRDSWDR
jgi:hypothetical protein